MINDDVRRLSFEQADANLKSLFSLYPNPGKMDACPCCVDSSGVRALKIDDVSTYLRHAMTTWGNSDDFKYHLPVLFRHVYIMIKGIDDDFSLAMKLNDVEQWKPEELEAITGWYEAFSQYYLYMRYLKCLQEWREEVQNWLDGRLEELDGPFPFDTYSDFFIEEIYRFCDPRMFECTINPLELWPVHYHDYLAFAACVKNYRFFRHDRAGRLQSGIFDPEVVYAWTSSHHKTMEELFWQSPNPKAQQLLSDAIAQLEIFLD